MITSTFADYTITHTQLFSLVYCVELCNCVVSRFHKRINYRNPPLGTSSRSSQRGKSNGLRHNFSLVLFIPQRQITTIGEQRMCTCDTRQESGCKISLNIGDAKMKTQHETRNEGTIGDNTMNTKSRNYLAKINHHRDANKSRMVLLILLLYHA